MGNIITIQAGARNFRNQKKTGRTGILYNADSHQFNLGSEI